MDSASKANKHQTATPVPKTTVKRRRKEAITNDDTIQEPTLINKLLELSDDDDDLSEGCFHFIIIIF